MIDDADVSEDSDTATDGIEIFLRYRRRHRCRFFSFVFVKIVALV